MRMQPEQHEIGSGLSEKQLGYASWWVQNSPLLKKIGFGLLITFAAVNWGFVFWTLLDGFVISYPLESRIVQHIAQNELTLDTLLQTAPKPVQTSDISIFSATGNRQNFLVQMTNDNTQWWAEFTYHFTNGDVQTPDHKSYILPQSQRYLTELGWRGASFGNAQLVIDNVRWHRISADVVGAGKDYASFANDRNQLQLLNPEYKNDLTIGTQTIGRTNFTLTNPSGFGFWEVEITAILYRAGSAVGVTSIVERTIKPGETRPITIDWFENLPGVSKTELQANVNVLDPSVYLPSSKFTK